MGSNIVHQYFKREAGDLKIIVKVDPIRFRGTELTISGGTVTRRKLDFDEAIFEDLKADGFAESSALEFNLYESGLA